MTPLRPFGPHVLVTKPNEDDTRAQRIGMWLPTSIGRLQRGVVVEVGDCSVIGFREVPLEPGYVVLYTNGDNCFALEDDLVMVRVDNVVGYEE